MLLQDRREDPEYVACTEMDPSRSFMGCAGDGLDIVLRKDIPLGFPETDMLEILFGQLHDALLSGDDGCKDGSIKPHSHQLCTAPLPIDAGHRDKPCRACRAMLRHRGGNRCR